MYCNGELLEMNELTEEERSALLRELCESGAGCIEIAMRTGFIRIYEEGEEQCKCKDCSMEFEI